MDAYEKKILTENPYEELWNYLSYFENKYNCSEYLRSNHTFINKDERKQRAIKLKYYIKQAREYYSSSLNVSTLTKPTLLYYGAVCLVEALILARRGYPDDSKHHGLSDKKIGNENITDLKDFKVQVFRKGTFSELYKNITSNSADYDDIENTTWTLKELFSMVPEMKEIFEDTYNEKSQILKVERFFENKDEEYIKFKADLLMKETQDKRDRFISNIHGFQDSYLNPVILDGNVMRAYKKPTANGDITLKNIMGEEYLISQIEKDGKVINLPEILLHLIILYSLSMLSRYQIDLWGEGSLELEKADFYIIKEFLRISTRKFPNIVLNLLNDTNYIFSSERYQPQDIRVDKYEDQIIDIVNDVLEKKEVDKRLAKSIKEEKHDLWG